MAKVMISPLARADMREIADYIGGELRNPEAARRLIRRFREAVSQLGSFPERGSPLLAVGKQRVPYRYLVCCSYMIFYHLAAEGVMVDRVMYGRRDYMALLFGGELEEEE